MRHGLCTAPDEIIKRCLSVIIEETPVGERDRVSGEKLISILQESCKLAPGHTRIYLQLVAESSDEIRPLLQQLDDLSRQQGIVILPAKN